MTIKELMRSLSRGTHEHYSKHFSVLFTWDGNTTFLISVVRNVDQATLETKEIHSFHTVWEAYEDARVEARMMKDKYVYNYDNSI